MPADDFVFMQDSALRHHIEPTQLRIFFEKLFLILSVQNFQVQVWLVWCPFFWLKMGTTLTRIELF